MSHSPHRVKLTVLSTCAAIACAGCALQLRQESTLPSRLNIESQVPKVEQVDFGYQARFETCVGTSCSRPTRKTLPGDVAQVPTAWAPSAAESGVVSAIPGAEPQAEPHTSMRPIASSSSQEADSWRMTVDLSSGTAVRAESSRASRSALPSLPSTQQAALDFVAPNDGNIGKVGALPALGSAEVAPRPPAADDSSTEAHEERVVVNFAFAGVHLTAPAKAAIRDAMPKVRKAQRVVIAGRTDSVGDTSVNHAIALARAIDVRDYIKGMAPELAGTIAIDARGNCCFVASNSSENGRFKNRRVEIVIRGRADAS